MNPSNPNPPDPDRPRSIADLVGDLNAAPGLPEELAQSLSERLDAEFEVTAKQDTLDCLVHLKWANWETPTDPVAARRDILRRREAMAPMAEESSSRTTRGWGWGTLAAGLLLALLLTGLLSRGQHDWQSVVEALREQDSVRIEIADSQGAVDGRLVTRLEGIRTFRAGAASVLDLPEGMQKRFAHQENEPIETLLDRRAPAGRVAGQLFGLLVAEDNDLATRSKAPVSYELHSRSNAGNQVVLDMTLRRGHQSVDARAWIDRQSGLPSSIRVIGPEGDPLPRKLNFTYSGKTTALVVPQEGR